jgi:hypothetical protein
MSVSAVTPLPDAMSTDFDLASLPFGVGLSPYRIRGVAYLGTFVHCKQTLRGGVDDVKWRLRPPALRSFFDQRFNARIFYDVYPFAIFMRELAALRNLGVEELLVSLGTERARQDVHGVLKFMMRMVSAKTLSEHLSVLSTQWWGFLTLEQLEASPNRVTILAKGIPAPLRRFVLPIGVAYHVEALRLSGTASARSHFDPDFQVTSGEGLGAAGQVKYTVEW